MTLLKRLFVIITGLTVSFAIHTANYYYYDGEKIGEAGEPFVSDTVEVTDKILYSAFPYQEVTYTLEVPLNMTYSQAEFQKFEGVYLTKVSDLNRADESYLQRCAFIGDSLVYGMGLSGSVYEKYSCIGDSGRVVTGLTSSRTTIYNLAPESQRDTKTMIYWLEKLQPEIIYVMFGTNGVSSIDNVRHVGYFKAQITSMMETCPNSKVVIVSAPPWAKEVRIDNINTTDINVKINELNMLLLQLAYDMKLYFLNTAEVLKDGDGFLKDGYHFSDGLHWNNDGRKLVADYIETHPIP